MKKFFHDIEVNWNLLIYFYNYNYINKSLEVYCGQKNTKWNTVILRVLMSSSLADISDLEVLQ